MFFVLSKSIDFLLSPILWVILMLLLGVFSRRQNLKKYFFSGGICLLFFFSNSFIANEALLAWESRMVPLSGLDNYKTAIVLTGITRSADHISDRVFFGKGADRLLHTIQLYKAGKIRNILISGGSGSLGAKSRPEAQKLKDVFLYCGVAENDLIIEDKSRNTTESARYSKALIDSLNLGNRFLLITSAFHMPRSLGCFKKAGLNVSPYPVDYYSNRREFDIGSILIPSEVALENWSMLIHELAGYVVYKIMGYS